MSPAVSRWLLGPTRRARVTHGHRTSLCQQTRTNVVGSADAGDEPTPVPVPRAPWAERRASPRGSGPQRVVVRGLTHALDIQGDGEPILFIHGFPLDRTMWRQVTATLTRWRRIAPDLRGLGASAVPERYSMAEYADDLAALLETLRCPRAVICGFSMGGYIAFELLRRYPNKIRALILVNTRATADTAEGKKRRDEMIALVQSQGSSGLADVMIPQMLAPTSLTAMPQVVQDVRAMISGNPAAGVIGALRAMRDRGDATPLLPAISVPTLVIAGRDDRIIPPPAARELAAAISGALLTMLPDAGHLAPLEQPVATSRVIAQFLESMD